MKLGQVYVGIHACIQANRGVAVNRRQTRIGIHLSARLKLSDGFRHDKPQIAAAAKQAPNAHRPAWNGGAAMHHRHAQAAPKQA